MIHALHFMDIFVRNGLTDFDLPFEYQTWPSCLQGRQIQEEFFEAQKHVVTNAKEMEKKVGIHQNLDESADVHFHSIRVLGQGGFGRVDLVWSKLSLKQYARKRVLRSKSPKMKHERLVKEVQILKKLSHRHLIKYVGSYTDREYTAYLMEPIAEYNLLVYLNTPNATQRSNRSRIQHFYGCLAGAVHYLHTQKIRHADITSCNVLIKNDCVYISDFGTAKDFSQTGKSTTQDRTPVNFAYIAPEVARNQPKNTSSDMWSLGVVFLELTTVLLGHRLKAFWSYMGRSTAGREQPSVQENLPAASMWLDFIKSEDGDEANEPIAWVKTLLQSEPRYRLSSKRLMNDIQSTPSFRQFCCQDCWSDFTDGNFEYEIDYDRPRFGSRRMSTDRIQAEAAARLGLANSVSKVVRTTSSNSISAWLASTVENIPSDPDVLDGTQTNFQSACTAEEARQARSVELPTPKYEESSVKSFANSSEDEDLEKESGDDASDIDKKGVLDLGRGYLLKEDPASSDEDDSIEDPVTSSRGYVFVSDDSETETDADDTSEEPSLAEDTEETLACQEISETARCEHENAPLNLDSNINDIGTPEVSQTMVEKAFVIVRSGLTSISLEDIQRTRRSSNENPSEPARYKSGIHFQTPIQNHLPIGDLEAAKSGSEERRIIRRPPASSSRLCPFSAEGSMEPRSGAAGTISSEPRLEPPSENNAVGMEKAPIELIEALSSTWNDEKPLDLIEQPNQDNERNDNPSKDASLSLVKPLVPKLSPSIRTDPVDQGLTQTTDTLRSDISSRAVNPIKPEKEPVYEKGSKIVKQVKFDTRLSTTWQEEKPLAFTAQDIPHEGSEPQYLPSKESNEVRLYLNGPATENANCPAFIDDKIVPVVNTADTNAQEKASKRPKKAKRDREHTIASTNGTEIASKDTTSKMPDKPSRSTIVASVERTGTGKYDEPHTTAPSHEITTCTEGHTSEALSKEAPLLAESSMTAERNDMVFRKEKRSEQNISSRSKQKAVEEGHRLEQGIASSSEQAEAELKPVDIEIPQLQNPDTKNSKAAPADVNTGDSIHGTTSGTSDHRLKRRMWIRQSKRKQQAKLLPEIYLAKVRNETQPGDGSVASSKLSQSTMERLKSTNWNPMLDRSYSLLEKYCRSGDWKCVRALLKSGSNPGTKKKPRPVPMLNAVLGASQKHANCVKVLLEFGADPNVSDRMRYKKTALQLAIENPYSNDSGYKGLINLLVFANADPNAKDRNGEYTIEKIFKGSDKVGLEPHREEALALLLQSARGTNFNVKSFGTQDTPLHLAVCCRSSMAVAMLLHMGADVNAVNSSGSTPLISAALMWRGELRAEEEEILNLLTQRKGVRLDIASGVFKRTALHYAVIANMPVAVEILLEAGADPRMKDGLNFDALSLLKICNARQAMPEYEDMQGMIQEALDGLIK
ncbi:hypothetical protein SLS56_007728 [Neofusicoccum ribis]|uniref:EKC/KEOPS complex subunit BUD32 n=1 Tax=Neofusicoccum ribis TaxID=45134 RepID=A0ABR3SM21_9PEZI